MKQTKLSNLKWLIISLVATSSVGFIKMGAEVFPPIDIVFNMLEFIVFISLIIFTKETFYKDRQSIFKYVVSISAGLSIGSTITCIFRIFSNDIPLYLLELYLLSQATIIASIWHSSASFSSLKMIKNENININIKLRYKYIGISAIFLAIQGFLFPIHGLLISFLGDVYIAEIYSFFNVVLSLGFAFSQFYAWIFLGKKIEQIKAQSTLEEDLSEEELMQLINRER
ncbi:MAG: hypothetical protein ACFFBP_13270 [Promethearchaeota archaeon]